MTLGIYVNPGLHSRKTFAERKRGETGCFSLVARIVRHIYLHLFVLLGNRPNMVTFLQQANARTSVHISVGTLLYRWMCCLSRPPGSNQKVVRSLIKLIIH